MLALLGGLTCLGIGTRPAGLLFTLGMGMLAAWQMGFGFFDHELVLVLELLLISVLAPGGDRLGLADVLAWARARGSGDHARWVGSLSTRIPGWGEHLALVLLLSVYLAAGVAKLRWGGIAWFSGETLGFYFSGVAGEFGRQLMVASPSGLEHTWRDGIGLTDFTYRSVGSDLSRWLAAQHHLLQIMAVGGTLLELAAPLAVLGHRIRNSYLVCMATFHLMNGILMGLPFYGYQLICVSLLVWRSGAAVSTGANDPVDGGIPGAGLPPSDHGRGE